jgi:hypothetical protein
MNSPLVGRRSKRVQNRDSGNWGDEIAGGWWPLGNQSQLTVGVASPLHALPRFQAPTEGVYPPVPFVRINGIRLSFAHGIIPDHGAASPTSG